jgi:hypothetical protein
MLGGFSRILAITAHLGFATLIMLAYRRTWLFYPLAIVMHFFLDFTTFGVQNLTGSLLRTLLVFGLWAIAALILLVRVRRLQLIAEPQKAAPAVETLATHVVAE